jgi:2-polyprenyl-3-methyl-5-hydroxy-6-metoxy-1,4-benzoquinol methylase
MQDIESINRQYYNKLYRPSNVLLRWLHGRLSFDQQSKNRPNRAALESIFQGMLREQGRVKILDYGCGWGVFLLGLPRQQVDAYCYDISEPAMAGLEDVMKMLKRKVGRIGFGEDGRIIPDGFDIIVCSHVLEHVADDRALLAKLTRALRPGGYLLINVPLNEVQLDPKHIHSYSPESLKKVMTETGLSCTEAKEACKLGGILRTGEPLKPLPVIRSTLLRTLRAILALLPYKLILWGERVILAGTPYRQLIVVGRK